MQLTTSVQATSGQLVLEQCIGTLSQLTRCCGVDIADGVGVGKYRPPDELF